MADDDEAAFEELYRRYADRVQAYLWRFTGVSADAADLRQDVFVRLWRQRSRWRDRGSAVGFLMRTARNLAIDVARRRELHERSLRDADVGPARLAGPERAFERRDLARRLTAAVDALPDRPREVFALKRDAGLSYREIGELLGISPKTVENHMSRALARLRDALHEFRGAEQAS